MTFALFRAFLRPIRTVALTVIACTTATTALAVTCKVATAATPSEADTAFLHSDYNHAATLYQQELQQKPRDPELTVKLARVFLKQQKISDADALIHNALAQDPNSVAFLTMLGEVQYREGTPWLAADSAANAMKADPCYPRLYLLVARIARLNSLYAASANAVATAYALDPHDPEIHFQWLGTLPLKQRAAELESYLAQPNGDDAEDTRDLHFQLDYLKQRIVEPHKACRLASDTQAANIPFALILRDPSHILGFGLDVKLNNKSTRLEIDTGAGGLVISRSVAERAGLKVFSRFETEGIGDKGRVGSYTTYADDIKIGSLEFRDCEVEVIDKGNVAGIEGLIGMDVFSRFLVTLDYPMHKLILGPLPLRPGDTTPNKPSLETDSNADAADLDAGSNGTTNELPSSSSKATSPAPHDRYIAPEMKDWTPVYRIAHNLLIPTSLNNSALKTFVLDTGAFTATISPAAAREVTKVHSDGSIPVKGISGEVNKVYTADEITFRFGHVSQKVRGVVTFDSPQLSKDLNMEVSGLIGITALGQLTMSIDYRDGLVKLSYDPNRGYQHSAY